MKNFSNQPAALRTYFLTEMWERFGFYAVQSLLALYLALFYKWPDNEVYALVGSFTAITYISPIIGGWIADNLLGQKKTIILGTFFLFISYIALSLTYSKITLIAALTGVAVGTGLLKPNISSLLGNEYANDASHRETGFTIFYMGITTGIILGTTIPSIISRHVGWSASFLSAALGMIIALSTFVIGIRRHAIKDYQSSEITLKKGLTAVFLIIAMAVISFSILYLPHFARLSFGLVVGFSILYLYLTSKKESTKQGKKTIAIGLLCLISVLFWAFYFQMFLSLTLFITRVASPSFLGIDFPPPYYVSLQSFGMLFFGFFITRRKKKHTLNQPSGVQTCNKFMGSLLFMIFAYAIICLICHSSTNNNLLYPLLFIPSYLLISISELLLSPVGLSAITVLSSRKKVSTMMGIFFVSLGVGGFLSGELAKLTAIDNTHMSVAQYKQFYTLTFDYLLLILLGSTFICFLLSIVIKKLLKSD